MLCDTRSLDHFIRTLFFHICIYTSRTFYILCSITTLSIHINNYFCISCRPNIFQIPGDAVDRRKLGFLFNL